MAYPTTTELQNLLLAAGLITDVSSSPDNLLDYSGAIDSAVEEWESVTRWSPFLKDGSDVTRHFDAPNSRVLDLCGGLMTLTSVTVNGDSYAEGTDFVLKPRNAVADGKCYRFLYFSTVQRSLEQLGGEIVIIGKWGAVTTIPADVKNAVLHKAAALLGNEIAAKQSRGGLSSLDIHNSVKESYDGAGVARVISGWNKIFESAALRYYRNSIA